MIPNTHPEPASKFTPEQCLCLGKAYALILSWNKEDDDLLVAQQAGQQVPASSDPQDDAVFSEIPELER